MTITPTIATVVITRAANNHQTRLDVAVYKKARFKLTFVHKNAEKS
jgi:hypothetical protein